MIIFFLLFLLSINHYNKKILVKNMKKNMKLMQVYEIQKLHQMHKDKLSSIRSINNRQKTYQSVSSNIEKINNFKKTKIQSQNYVEKERILRINSQNKSLHTRMVSNNSQREGYYQKQIKRKETPHIKNRNSVSVNQKISQENAKIKSRLANTKSSFQNARFQRKPTAQSRRLSHQQEVVNILERQLNLKPVVVFPTLQSAALKRNDLKSRKQKFKESKYDSTKNGISHVKDVQNGKSMYVGMIQTE